MSASEARWTTGLGSIRTRCANCSPCPCRFGVMRRFGVMAWSRIGMRPRVQALARCRPGGARARRGPAFAAAEQRQHLWVRLGGQLAAAIGRDCSRRAAGSARCAQSTHGRTEHRTNGRSTVVARSGRLCRKPMASSVIVPCVPSKSPPGMPIQSSVSDWCVRPSTRAHLAVCCVRLASCM